MVDYDIDENGNPTTPNHNPSEVAETVDDRAEYLLELSSLSPREAEAVAWKSYRVPAEVAAEEMDIATSTFNEYLKRARTKARKGFYTYDVLDEYGVLTEDLAED